MNFNTYCTQKLSTQYTSHTFQVTKTEFAGSNLILELSECWLRERITLPQGIHLQELQPVSTEYLILG